VPAHAGGLYEQQNMMKGSLINEETYFIVYAGAGDGDWDIRVHQNGGDKGGHGTGI